MSLLASTIADEYPLVAEPLVVGCQPFSVLLPGDMGPCTTYHYRDPIERLTKSTHLFKPYRQWSSWVCD